MEVLIIIGALIIRIEFCGYIMLYFLLKEPPN